MTWDQRLERAVVGRQQSYQEVAGRFWPRAQAERGRVMRCRST